MQGIRNWAANGRSGLILLFALTLLLRMLVPQGWMPAEGSFGIRPCLPVSQLSLASAPSSPNSHPDAHHAGPGGHHPQASYHHHHASADAGHAEIPGKPASHDHGQKHRPDQPCGFSALGFAAGLPHDVAAAIPTPFAAALLILLPGAASVVCGLAAPPPPQTGPPAIV